MVDWNRHGDGRYTNVYGPSVRGCVLAVMATSVVGTGVLFGLFRLFAGHLSGLRIATVGAVVLFFLWILLAIIDETFAPLWRLWALGLAVAIGLGYLTGWLATVIVVATLIILQALLSSWWALSDRLALIESKLELRMRESRADPSSPPAE